VTGRKEKDRLKDRGRAAGCRGSALAYRVDVSVGTSWRPVGSPARRVSAETSRRSNLGSDRVSAEASRWPAALAVLLLLICFSSVAVAADRVELTLNDGRPILARSTAVTVTGVAAGLSEVELVLLEEDGTAESEEPQVGVTHRVSVSGGAFSFTWPEALAGGAYLVRATAEHEGMALAAEVPLVVQPEGRWPRRPLIASPEPERTVEPRMAPDDFQAFTDRWRIVPPPYELDTASRGPLDPYHQNRWKGDYPIRGQDLFLVVTAISDTLVDGAELPTPAGVSTDRPGSIGFFGEPDQLVGKQLVLASAELFRGDTAFVPPRWRAKATLAADLNHLEVEENAVVRPDVREGTRRTRGFLALQEAFYERRLAVVSPNFDFVSVRAGIQPFQSDFRGFVFSDTNLGVRLFGNLRSNRFQYNLAFFERLEKDTNSGLNTFEWRDQRVAVANLYRQDFPVLGIQTQASVHWFEDEATFVFDKNGFLVRPDPVGSFTPHEIEATYLGLAAFGHLGRINVDAAAYYVTGRDSLNPIAGPGRLLRDEPDRVDVEAGMAALELSFDRDWLRPKAAVFWASGDAAPTDRTARGFDAIFDNPNFAGGGFSFWNRLGIRLAGTGVALVHRGSLLPSLESSKDEGQPNFVNPGLVLLSAGLDLELTPEIKAVVTANHLRFDTTETLELVLFQAPIDEEIGWDLSVGARWRPYLSNNVVLLAGLSALLPGDGFADIYEDDSALASLFPVLALTY